MEMQNAETKRVASSSGCRRLETSGPSRVLIPMKGGKLGPEKLVNSRGYSTTMALSTLRHLLVAQKLRRGDGPFALPDSRRRERLFGSVGRTSSMRSSQVKQEQPNDYKPRKDTCIKAFVHDGSSICMLDHAYA